MWFVNVLTIRDSTGGIVYENKSNAYVACDYFHINVFSLVL